MSVTRASNIENFFHYENPDSFAAICKDCGNGTLNNASAPAFKIIQGYDEFEDECYVICLACGSRHINLEVL
jgi:hypothetical protein